MSHPVDGPPDCERVREQLYVFIDKELEGASMAEIEAHLAGCAPCLNRVAIERTVKALVHRCGGEECAPESLRTRIAAITRTTQIEMSSDDDGVAVTQVQTTRVTEINPD